MTVFLLPDGRPFYGGTYFPPEARGGLPSFRQVLDGIAAGLPRAPRRGRAPGRRDGREPAGGPARRARRRASGSRRRRCSTRCSRCAASTTSATAASAARPSSRRTRCSRSCCACTAAAAARRRSRWRCARSRRMADGGIHDQLGGGFHRYAVDAIWLVPHFEQMLYDNALLARAYLAAWQVTGDEQWREVAEGILDYLLRELALEHGGFASAQDADTDGVEGATFTWTPAAAARGALRRGRRARRAHLGRDGGRQLRGRDGALAGRRARGRRGAAPGSRACARSCSRRAPPARSRRSTTRRSRAGTAWRWRRSPRARASAGAPTCWRRPSAAPPSCSGRSRTPTAGSGARTAPGAARCPASSTTTRRSRSACTSSTSRRASTATWPSRAASRCSRASASARPTARSSTPRTTPRCSSRARASSTTTRRRRATRRSPGCSCGSARTYGEPELERHARAVVAQVGPLLARAPQGFGHLLGVCDALLAPPREAAVVGARGRSGDGRADRRAARPLRARSRRRVRRRRATTCGVPLLAGRGLVDGRPAVYVCSGFVCAAPATDAHMVRTALLNANPT